MSYEFIYDDWNTVNIGNSEGEPYLIYLEEGRHTIELVVMSEVFSETLIELETTAEVLSYVIQRIIMVTSISPDVNYDYRLDETIPDLMENLQVIADSLAKQIELLESMSQKISNAVNSLKELNYRVTRCWRIQEEFRACCPS